ncbi:MAG: putative amidase enhancer [Candidatus Ozemobacter sibiricus]|uniref:Putative amidase enhancer n=1 Tax=Candidatus Ozemobacter sibiricus TaxID=2268124 RepID=A0A367ZKA3_9BACT|nr:MAG: putative amidase enhancer [Candidatus Ozemobacter sibiricus]
MRPSPLASAWGVFRRPPAMVRRWLLVGLLSLLIVGRVPDEAGAARGKPTGNARGPAPTVAKPGASRRASTASGEAAPATPARPSAERAGATAPVLRLKVAEYATGLTFRMPQGGTWSLGGKTGRLARSDRAEVSGRLQSRARQQYHVVVESVPMRDPERVAAALAKWRATGRPIHTYQAGRQSPTWDGRVLYIAAGLFPTREAAQKLVDQLANDGQSSWIFAEPLALARGTIALTINGRRVAQGAGPLGLTPVRDLILHKVEYARGYSWHGRADRTYRGPLTIGWGAQDALDCVLATDLEHILAGVVPSEISSKAAPSALQAQAVAARGEILSKVGLRHLKEGFDFCAEQHCQVYAGDNAVTDRIAAEIAPTRGLILHAADGTILDAVYAANCGGRGDRNDLVWNSQPNPHLIGVWDGPRPLALDLTDEAQVASFIRFPPFSYCQDPTVEGGDKFRWTRTLTGDAWQKVVAAAGVGRIRQIDGLERGPSGRLYKVVIHGEKGIKTVMRELKIRQLFGGLRSACFVVAWQRDAAGFITGGEFTGAGWGHGVGMCQTGAQYLARQGWSFDRILLHYFPGARLVLKYR